MFATLEKHLSNKQHYFLLFSDGEQGITAQIQDNKPTQVLLYSPHILHQGTGRSAQESLEQLTKKSFSLPTKTFDLILQENFALLSYKDTTTYTTQLTMPLLNPATPAAPLLKIITHKETSTLEEAFRIVARAPLTQEYLHFLRDGVQKQYCAHGEPHICPFSADNEHAEMILAFHPLGLLCTTTAALVCGYNNHKKS
jgi:hypothetical protein